MSEPRKVVHILKLAGAQRQLDAAIRMTFAGEDLAAITTVAAAAYRVLRDLRQKDGFDVLAEEWRDNLLGIARAIVRGEMPEQSLRDFESCNLWPLISRLVQEITRLGAHRKISELRSIGTVEFSPDAKHQQWDSLNRAGNFLKHADRDHGDSPPEEELNAEELIMRACGLYFDIMGPRLTPEMLVFVTLYWLKHNVPPLEAGAFEKIAPALQACEPTKRLRMCAKLVKELKRDSK